MDRTAFFARFNEGDAVPYFYEPFLEAFDPDLRKQLGVWYMPSEVVRYSKLYCLGGQPFARYGAARLAPHDWDDRNAPSARPRAGRTPRSPAATN